MPLVSDAFSDSNNQLLDVTFQIFGDTPWLEKSNRKALCTYHGGLVDTASTPRQRINFKDKIVTKSADYTNQPGAD